MRVRSVTVVVALLLVGACGGAVVDPSPHENGSIQTHPSTEVDASALARDAGALAEPADTALVDAAPVAIDAACEYPLTGFTLQDLDTPCFGGPTGRQVLAMLSSSYTSTFVPATRPPATRPTGPTAPTPLTMTVAYAAGTITCKPEPPDCDLAPPEVTMCPCPEPEYGSFDIELVVTFQTADGSFNEQLSASTTFAWYATNATFTATLLADDLQGDYPPLFGLTETLDFQGTFAPTGSSSGALLERTSQDVGGGGSWGR